MIKQTKDVYVWGVTYHDGTWMSEYERPEGRGWAEIGDKPVKEVWLSIPHPNIDYGHRVLIPQGATPVFFRRRTLTINPNTSEQTQEPTVHCIGWKHDNKACYLFVFNDGSTLLTDNLQAV